MPLRQEALQASYRRLELPLFNVLYRQLWQAQDCQDVIHDAFVRVWERRDKVDEITLDALVWTTVLNLAKNRLRWRVLRRHDKVDDNLMVSADGEPQDFLAVRRLHEALRQLPQAWQQVLLLAEFSGLSGHEMAAVLGIPTGTVASRKHLAMQRLRQLMKATSDE
jgi:RNA polymerase sigma-70 factor (ECF subfamily)